MYAPHTVTVYNTERTVDTSDMTDIVSAHVTVIRGVFREGAASGKVRVGGIDGADSIKVFVPFGADARDGATRLPKKFVDPAEYAAAGDKSALWTLTTDGTTVVADGEASSAAPEMPESRRYVVTRYAVRDFGSVGMRHIEIEGA